MDIYVSISLKQTFFWPYRCSVCVWNISYCLQFQSHAAHQPISGLNFQKWVVTDHYYIFLYYQLRHYHLKVPSSPYLSSNCHRNSLKTNWGLSVLRWAKGWKCCYWFSLDKKVIGMAKKDKVIWIECRLFSLVYNHYFVYIGHKNVVARILGFRGGGGGGGGGHL